MIQLNVGGKIVDLYANTSLQFIRKNILFAFDAIELSRTAEFTIPATPNNNALFDLANDPARYGMQARVKHAAQLQYSGGVENGYLYVTNASKAEYTVIFVYGELLKLKAIKDAGNVSELAQFEDIVVLGGPYWTANDSANTGENVGIFENIAYADGHNTEPDAEVFIGYKTHYFPLPSWHLLSVLQRACTALGVALNTNDASSIDRIRVTVAKPTRPGETTNGVLNVVNNNSNSYIAKYIKPTKSQSWYKTTLNGEWQLWQIQTFQALTDCTLTIDNFAQDTCLVKILPPTELQRGTKIEKEVLEQDKEININRGEVFAIIPRSMYPTDNQVGIQPPVNGAATYSNETSVTVRGTGDVADKRNETLYLKDNLPEITLVDLLKIAAAITGTLLYFEDDTIYLLRGLEENNILHLEDIIQIDAVRRSFSDYAQSNKVIFYDNSGEREQGTLLYTIYNDNIAAEKTLLDTHLSVGELTTIGNAAQGYETGLVLVKNDIKPHVEEDNGVETLLYDFPAKHGTLLYMGNNYYSDQLPIARNEMMQILCERSTSLKVKVAMPLVEYLQIPQRGLIVMQGQRYVWTEAQWQDGVASLQLSKI